MVSGSISARGVSNLYICEGAVNAEGKLQVLEQLHCLLNEGLAYVSQATLTAAHLLMQLISHASLDVYIKHVLKQC